MNWVAVAYYCGHPIYKESSERLIKSANKFKVPLNVVETASRGDWFSNMQFKPSFIKNMLIKYAPSSVVYIDVDAEFRAYPRLFDTLANVEDTTPPVAVHILDHSKYRRHRHPPEMLSGTLFFRNNAHSMKIVDEWIEECQSDPKLWDQHALHAVLKRHEFTELPEEYCQIFDYMSSIKHPVITHYQASRAAKRAGVFK